VRLAAVLACTVALTGAASARAAPALQELGPLPTAAAQPQDIVQGPDGNMWFTERGANQIGRISGTNPGTATEFPIAAGGLAPDVIVVGPDGKLWWTELSSNSVGTMAPGNPAGVTRFTGLGLISPRGIAVGPDGNLWVADADGAGPKVVRVSPAGAAVGMPIALPVGFNPRGIARGADGNMWVANFSTPGSVARIKPGAPPTLDPPAGFPVPAGSPIDVIAGADGNIWYAGQGTTVGKVTPAGAATAYTSKGVDPFGIAVGPDGAVWFAEFQAAAVGRVDAAGTTSHVTGMTAGAGPRYVAAGPGNTIWFTEEMGNRVGRVTGIALPGGGGGGPGGGGGGGGGAADTKRPEIGPLRLSARRLRLGRSIALRFTLSEAADVTLSADRALAGRRVDGRCVKPRRRNRTRRRCTRYLRLRPSLSFPDRPAAKTQKLTFDGRLSKRRILTPGRYRLGLTARDAAGNTSRRLVVGIVVLPRRRS
jgi:virginiamycin B lyase